MMQYTESLNVSLYSYAGMFANLLSISSKFIIRSVKEDQSERALKTILRPISQRSCMVFRFVLSFMV